MPVVCGVAIVAVLRFGAPTITPAAPTPTPAASPAAPATAATDTPAPDYAAAVAKLKTADALYEYIDKNATTDDIQPDDALTHEEQVAQVRKLVDGKIALLRPAIDTFLKQYPQDPRHWEVQLQRVFFLKDAENISDEDSVNTLKAVAAAPDASASAHHRARATLLQNDLEETDPTKGLTDALEKELTAYEKDFPDDESGRDLVRLRLRLLQAGAPDKVNAMLAALTKSPNKFTAEAADAQLTIRTKPFDWKFDNAVDGKAVDLSKLHGKVVLLDFWATWCAPCMAKLPEIVELNKSIRTKAFRSSGCRSIRTRMRCSRSSKPSTWTGRSILTARVSKEKWRRGSASTPSRTPGWWIGRGSCTRSTGRLTWTRKFPSSLPQSRKQASSKMVGMALRAAP